MSVIVRIAGPLRQFMENKSEIEVTATKVEECLSMLESQFSQIKAQLRDEQGKLHRSVCVYVNGNDVRFLQQLATPLKAGDEVSIIPAFAGG